jgi:hypothetical protein
MNEDAISGEICLKTVRKLPEILVSLRRLLYPDGIFKFIFKPTENTVSLLQILTYVCHLEKGTRDDVTGEWRKLHNEELNDLYSLPNIVPVVKLRRMRWAGHVARMGEDRGVHRVLVGKPEGKSSLWRPRRRWDDNIKMDLQEVWGVVGTGWSWLRIGTCGGHLWVR